MQPPPRRGVARRVRAGLVSSITGFLVLLGVRASATLPAPTPAETVPPRSGFAPVFVGSGEIPDLVGAGRQVVPFERRIHVAFVPEGFTQIDLDRGVLDREIEAWMNEVFAIEPFATFREAFVVWKLPLASSEHTRPGQPGETRTALRVPLTKDGVGVWGVPPGSTTAVRLWEALRGFPVPLSFYGPGGHTNLLARNLIAVVPVLDGRTGRPGLSGRAIPIADPTDPSRRVATAFAFDRAHEFTHAFSRLTDEYLDYESNREPDEPRLLTSRTVINVVKTARCDALPWRHLLPGGAYDGGGAAKGVVGAFGVGPLGFHPELKCLLNGEHHNARHFGGNGRLRSHDRMCNFCREVTMFRLLERTGLLPDPETSWPEWESRYRAPYYRRFGFQVPREVPQRTDAGEAWYQPCEPGPAG